MLQVGGFWKLKENIRLTQLEFCLTLWYTILDASRGSEADGS